MPHSVKMANAQILKGKLLYEENHLQAKNKNKDILRMWRPYMFCIQMYTYQHTRRTQSSKHAPT